MGKVNEMTKSEYALSFQNLSTPHLTFEETFEEIVSFMKKDPQASFKLMIGTDSQAFSKHTRFITGIVIHREGKGAWACMRKYNFPRKIENLHEKISIETSLTEEVVSLFTEEKKNQLMDIVLPYIYKGGSFVMEGHLDIGKGKQNKTNIFVQEMVARIEATGVEAKIKPYAIIASGYANKYTK